jgi:hypothetical protein
MRGVLCCHPHTRASPGAVHARRWCSALRATPSADMCVHVVVWLSGMLVAACVWAGLRSADPGEDCEGVLFVVCLRGELVVQSV